MFRLLGGAATAVSFMRLVTKLARFILRAVKVSVKHVVNVVFGGGGQLG